MTEGESMGPLSNGRWDLICEKNIKKFNKPFIFSISCTHFLFQFTSRLIFSLRGKKTFPCSLYPYLSNLHNPWSPQKSPEIDNLKGTSESHLVDLQLHGWSSKLRAISTPQKQPAKQSLPHLQIIWSSHCPHQHHSPWKGDSTSNTFYLQVSLALAATCLL